MEKVYSAKKTAHNNIEILTNEGKYIIGLDSDFGLPYGVTEINGDIFKPVAFGIGLKIYKRLTKMMKNIDIKE